MARYTESGLRQLVRQLLMEAKGAKASVTITNSMRSPVEVTGIYSAKVTSIFAASDEDENLYDDVDGALLTIGAGETKSVSFTPVADGDAFKVFLERPTAGVTPGYSRAAIILPFTLKADHTAAVTVTSPESTDEEGDKGEMSSAVIDVLAHQAGEQYEVVEDPTDPEFAYAVYYTVTPTRAVIIRAPVEDYKGDNIVSSKGQEISPRRYGGSFRKVAQALVDKMKEAHPAVEAPAAAATP